MNISNDDELFGHDLASVLRLDKLGSDIFSGRIAASVVRDQGPWAALYGGQVAAQSLMAAGMTLPPGWRPHSLHGYFLRAGLRDRRIEFRVDRDRDGRSFSARHVSAMQDGKVIFSMLASFTNRDSPTVLDKVRSRNDALGQPEEYPRFGIDQLIDARQVTELRMHNGSLLQPDCLWMRTPVALADDPLTQAAALTYMSDLGSGFGQIEDSNLGSGGISLDHAMWFHEPIPSHEWMLLDMWPVSAVTGRGVYHGSLRDQQGRIGATIAQETLLRHLTAIPVEFQRRQPDDAQETA